MRVVWVEETELADGTWAPFCVYLCERDANIECDAGCRVVRYVPESPPLPSRSDEGDQQQSGDEE